MRRLCGSVDRHVVVVRPHPVIIRVSNIILPSAPRDTFLLTYCLHVCRACQMEKWQFHDVVDVQDHHHIPQPPDDSSADDSWRDWINSARNVDSLDPELVNGADFPFTPLRAQSLVSLL